DVINVSKIAGLFAVAKNSWFGFFQEGSAEFRKDAGIWRTGILAWSKNIEVAQADALQAVHFPKHLRVKFANVFCNAVGRNRVRLHRFSFGKRGCFSVSGRRSSEDDTSHFGVARRDQNIQSSLDVHLIGFERIFYRTGNGSARGEMQ